MQCSLYFTSSEYCATFGFRIVRTVYFYNVSVLIFDNIITFNEVSVLQAHFISWEETEIFFRRILHKVTLFNI
ncbi:hypothetical protein AOA62_04610 [Pseudomonas sp. 2995-3]|nr:hypothetical protein AOA62_04610 [Pseudomonas sp. 2995-3]